MICEACAIRVVIADDSLLVREGIASLLRRAGFEIAAEAAAPDRAARGRRASTGPTSRSWTSGCRPPTPRRGSTPRARSAPGIPQTAIVILSQHVEVGIAMRVLVENPERLGYLLKDRVTDIDDFAATLRHVAAGGSALDPQVVSQLLSGDRDDGPLTALTPREREVLELIAEGRSNKGIGERLDVSTGVVQKHVGSLFAKLGIPDSDDDHRRILAVLTFLRSLGASRLA